MQQLASRRRAVLPGVDARLAPLFAEVVELKRVSAAPSAGRSLADAGFRRAWAALLAGDDPEAVARTEVAYAAAHVALRTVDAEALADAGVSASDRRTVHRRAAGRALGALDPAMAASLDAIADGLPPPGPVPRFVEILSRSPRAAARGDGSISMPPSPQEMQSEHSWSTAVLAGLVQRSRGEPMGGAVLLGLAHHLCDADGMDPGTTLPRDPRAAGLAAEERALSACPAGLAAAVRALLSVRDDIGGTIGSAFQIAAVVDRVIQQRHYANLAGFSLSDAVDSADLVRRGPLQQFHHDALTALGLAF